MKIAKDRALNINGVLYFDVKTFAKVTNSSEQRIRVLMSRGNTRRKLKCKRIAGKPLIPYTELTEFPFTTPGRKPEVYYYNEEGKIAEPSATPTEETRAVQDDAVQTPA